MKSSLSYMSLPIIIAINAANVASLIDKSRTLCGDIGWDWIVTTGVLIGTVGLGLAITLVSQNSPQLILLKENRR